jgi:FkbM family methyltransferase
MKTLVYLGCNTGFGLNKLLNKFSFDKLILVEANPVAFNHLQNNFKNLPNAIFVNKCIVADKNIETTKFYRTKNLVSSSALKPATHNGFHDYGGVVDVVDLETIYLPNLLEMYDVDHINFYVSDIQGNDFSVLKTINNFIDEQKIDEMFMETYNSSHIAYDNSNNQFNNYYNLLKTNYKVDYYSADGTVYNTVHDITKFLMNDAAGELDVHWSSNKLSTINYFWN